MLRSEICWLGTIRLLTTIARRSSFRTYIHSKVLAMRHLSSLSMSTVHQMQTLLRPFTQYSKTPSTLEHPNADRKALISNSAVEPSDPGIVGLRMQKLLTASNSHIPPPSSQASLITPLADRESTDMTRIYSKNLYIERSGCIPGPGAKLLEKWFQAHQGKSPPSAVTCQYAKYKDLRYNPSSDRTTQFPDSEGHKLMAQLYAPWEKKVDE